MYWIILFLICLLIYVKIPSNLNCASAAHIHRVDIAIFVYHCNRDIRNQLIELHQETLVSAVVHTCHDLHSVVFSYKPCRCTRSVVAEDYCHISSRALGNTVEIFKLSAY